MVKTILLGLVLILLVSIVNAYDIIEDVNRGKYNMTYVNYTFPEGISTYGFEVFSEFCKVKWFDLNYTIGILRSIEEGEDITKLDIIKINKTLSMVFMPYNCSHDDYIDSINKEMDKIIAKGFKKIIFDTDSDTYEGDYANIWFVTWVKKIINKIIGRVDNLESENQMLKERLILIENMLNITDETPSPPTDLYDCSYRQPEECQGGLSAPNKDGFQTRCYQLFKLGWNTCSTGWVKI